MVRIPDMGKCPDCGLAIQKYRTGPHGLAHHECRPRRKVNEAIARLLDSPDLLTPEQVADVTLRAMLASAADDPSPTVLLELWRTLAPRPDGRTLRGKAKDDAPAPEGLLSWLKSGGVVEDP